MNSDYSDFSKGITTPFILYSRGQLLDGTDQSEALERLASITKRSTAQIQARLLTGKRKRIKSSESLEKLIRLKERLAAAGLDVYIDYASAAEESDE